MLFTGLGRFVLGETVPSVWVPPSALLPIWTSQPVNNIYLLKCKSLICTESALLRVVFLCFRSGPSCSKGGEHYPLDSAIGCRNAYPLDSAIQLSNNRDQAIDNKCEAVLVLYDLTAAFDTTYHAILLDRLGYRYPKWFFVGLNHILKIVLNALPSIRFFLDQDIGPVGSRKGRSLDCCYSRCISPLLNISSPHTVSTQ